MGSSACPKGSPQYNLAKRFKKGGDLHHESVSAAGVQNAADRIQKSVEVLRADITSRGRLGASSEILAVLSTFLKLLDQPEAAAACREAYHYAYKAAGMAGESRAEDTDGGSPEAEAVLKALELAMDVIVQANDVVLHSHGRLTQQQRAPLHRLAMALEGHAVDLQMAVRKLPGAAAAGAGKPNFMRALSRI